MISFKCHYSMTLRYASRDYIHKERAHLGIRPQLQTQGAFLGSEVFQRVILTGKKKKKTASEAISFTNICKYISLLEGNSRHSYLHMCYVMCAYFK